MLSISANITEKIKNVSYLRKYTYILLSKIVKKNKISPISDKKPLDKMSDIGDNYSIRMKNPAAARRVFSRTKRAAYREKEKVKWWLTF
jgi:hypothetical protein